MTPSPTATFRDPLPADYGRAIQRQARNNRKATPPAKHKPTGIELILSPAGAAEAQRNLDEMKRRALIQPLADKAWRELTPFYRAWLALRGETPIGYFEAHR